MGWGISGRIGWWGCRRTFLRLSCRLLRRIGYECLRRNQKDRLGDMCDCHCMRNIYVMLDIMQGNDAKSDQQRIPKDITPDT